MGRMKNPEEHIGERFGRLTIVEYIPADKGDTCYKCVCDCSPDKIIEVKWTDLTQKRRQSCGCFKKEQGFFRALDLTGQIFGDFRAIEKTDMRKSGKVVWLAECCHCGHKDYFSTRQLKVLPDRHCPVCHKLPHNSKGEEKIVNLLSLQQFSFSSEKTFEGCSNPKTGAKLRFDFYVENKWIVEFDGIQHFEITPFSRDLEYVKLKDETKNQYCRDNHIPLIRIPYYAYDDMTLLDLIPSSSRYLVVTGKER